MRAVVAVGIASAIASMGCGSSGSCTLGEGETKICYELNSVDADEQGALEGGCKGTYSEDACNTDGARFACTNGLYNFYTPAASNEVRTLRFDYYFWNPGYQAGGACEAVGGTHEVR